MTKHERNACTHRAALLVKKSRQRVRKVLVVMMKVACTRPICKRIKGRWRCIERPDDPVQL